MAQINDAFGNTHATGWRGTRDQKAVGESQQRAPLAAAWRRPEQQARRPTPQAAGAGSGQLRATAQPSLHR